MNNHSKFIDKLIFNQPGKQFDDLLTHLESATVVPSVDVIKVLFTLVSTASNEPRYIPYNQRANYILNKYIESRSSQLYLNLLQFIQEFAEVQHIIYPSPKTTRKRVEGSSEVNDIINLIETSPRKKQVVELISDSEEETSILHIIQEELDNMSEEVNKYKNIESSIHSEIVLSGTPVIQDKFNMFEEGILSVRLKQRNYTLWKLVNWAFYCSGKSNSNYHALYVAHSNALQLIFTLLEIDLVNNKPQCLLSKLIIQLSHFKSSWYDRLVEYVFNGLIPKDSPMPQTCYPYEKEFIKRDSMPRDNNNVDSIKLRFKIVNMVYYWSLEESDSTSTDSLLKQVTSKLTRVDYEYLVEFYYSVFNSSKIEFTDRKKFLIRLSQYLLSEFTVMDFKQDIDLQLVLKWMGTSNIYLQITEDETFVKFKQFLHTWLKFNYILGWLFSIVIEECQEKDHIDVDSISNICKQADLLRLDVFNEYIDHCIDLELKFQLTKEQAITYKSSISWESYIDILNYTWV